MYEMLHVECSRALAPLPLRTRTRTRTLKWAPNVHR